MADDPKPLAEQAAAPGVSLTGEETESEIARLVDAVSMMEVDEDRINVRVTGQGALPTAGLAEIGSVITIAAETFSPAWMEPADKKSAKRAKEVVQKREADRAAKVAARLAREKARAALLDSLDAE